MRAFSTLLNSAAFLPIINRAAETGNGTPAPEPENDEPTPAELLAEGQQMVKEGDIKLDDMRTHYRVTFQRDTKLSDDEIIMVYMLAEDDQKPEGWAKLMETAETNTPKHEGDDALKKKAETVYALAEKLNANAVLQTHGMETVTAPEKTKRGAAVVCVDLINDDNFDMDSLPRPGSVKVPGSNQPYDLYTRTANDGTEITGSFFTDLAARTSIGKQALERKEAFIKVRDNIEGKDENLAKLAPTKVDSEIAKHNQRFNRWEKLLTEAAQMYYIMSDVADNMPLVTAAFQYEDTPSDAGEDYKPVLYDTTKCLYIQSKTNPANIKALYPSEFIRLKPADAIKAGGKWSDLLGTAKRKRKPRAGGATATAQAAAEAKAPMLTVPDFKDWVVRGANLLDWESTDGQKHQAAIVSATAKWSDDEVLSFQTLYAAMDSIWVKSALQQRAEAIGGKTVDNEKTAPSQKRKTA